MLSFLLMCMLSVDRPEGANATDRRNASPDRPCQPGDILLAPRIVLTPTLSRGVSRGGTEFIIRRSGTTDAIPDRGIFPFFGEGARMPAANQILEH
jgi:hypothetical protein